MESGRGNKVIIISNKNNKIRRFLDLGVFPKIDISSQMSHILDIDRKQAQIYIDYYGI